MAKRVIVNNKYTYEVDFPVKVGDCVVLPSTANGLVEGDDTWEGKVTSLYSSYTGPCRKIIRKVDDETVV